MKMKTIQCCHACFLAILLCVVDLRLGVKSARAQDLSPARIQEIQPMLSPQPSGFGVPCSDRTAWSAKAPDLKDAVSQAEQDIAASLAPRWDACRAP